MRRRTRAFARNRRIKGGEIDQPRRLGAEDERVVLHALLVDLRLDSEFADALEARLRRVLDSAVEQVGGDQVLRILQRAAQRGDPAAAAAVVFRRPGILIACVGIGDDAANRRRSAAA